MTENSHTPSRHMDTVPAIEHSVAGAALLKAVSDLAFFGVERAIQAGASPTALYADPNEGEPARVTAVWQNIRNGSGEYLVHMLGEHAQREVPLAYENKDEGAVGLFDALAKLYIQNRESYSKCSSQLDRCFDFSSPAVAHAAWNLVESILAPRAAHGLAHISDFISAEKFLERGARPEEGAAAWECLMSRRVALYDDQDITVSMMSCMMTSTKYAEIVRCMLDDGVNPNAHFLGMPFLHYLAVNKSDASRRATQHMIEAGADLEATCSVDEIRSALGNTLDSVSPEAMAALPPAVTLEDAAKLFKNFDMVQLLESHRAKFAIDAVIKSAVARKGLG